MNRFAAIGDGDISAPTRHRDPPTMNRFRSLSAAAALVCVTAASAWPQARCDPASAIARVDHVPVAVRDLEAAVRDFAALGFSFKPGRPHPNSILNQHVKFRDGTEVELITAT
ncbi:MAG TPA: VOC family protein, partial [Longimicrobiaceae bacterium]